MRLFEKLWHEHRLTTVTVGVAVLIGGGALAQRIQQPPLEQPQAAAATPREIVVDITGAVATPGVRRLPEGSLVEDAIAAAGGLTDQADQERLAKDLNRAEALKNHQKIVVPSLSDRAAAAESADGLINLNTATLEQLDTLPGIGPATAEKIIAYREQSGGFQSVEDLQEVPGIGDAKFAELKDKVTV